MIGIRRIAIDSNVVAITPQLNLPLRRLVARLAQALQLAEHEGIPVSPVRGEVIHHIRRRDDAALEAKTTQWMTLQLQLPQPLPAPGLVEGVPLRQVAANSRHSCQALIRKKSFCQSDAQATQPDQSPGDEIS